MADLGLCYRSGPDLAAGSNRSGVRACEPFAEFRVHGLGLQGLGVYSRTLGLGCLGLGFEGIGFLGVPSG